jgi:hypothetical protein
LHLSVENLDSLYRVHGNGALLIPEDGPLCVPGKVEVILRLSGTAAMQGLAAVLESP